MKLTKDLRVDALDIDAERGTHAELMARSDGAYRRFVAIQTRGAA
jgi:ABC-type multidrug transport system fused ATPase/permease subunit